MKKIRLIALLILGVLAVGCVQDVFQNEVPVVEEDGLVQAGYDVEFEPATKSVLSGMTPVWEVGEKVSVYDPVASVAREFTVESVDGSRAVISGKISQGDFAFSAVYPAACAKEWKSATECVISVPQNQTIKGDANIDSGVLASQAYAENTEDGIVFKNMVSLLKFTIGVDDISKVSFTLSGASQKTYTVSASSGNLDPEKEYYVSVDPAEYASGVKFESTTAFDISYSKSSTKKLNAKKNAIVDLGLVTKNAQKHINYNIFSEEQMDGLNGYLKELGALDNETLASVINMDLIQNITAQYFPAKDETAKIIRYTYTSADPDGNPTPMSAFMIYPQTTRKGIILGNHYSFSRAADCPTENIEYETAICWRGYVLVMPDYYGFGASKDKPQAYADYECLGRGCVDAYLAAKQILGDLGVSYGSQTYNLGYSQGGYVTMAALRYASEHPELGAKFDKSFAGAGPNDLELTEKQLVKGGFPDVIVYAVVSIVSFIECNHLDIDYKDVFLEPLLSKYKDWILSKRYSSTKLANLFGTDDVTKLFAPPIFDESSYVMQELINQCRENSMVTKDWTVTPGCKVYIHHSRNDDYLPYENMANMAAFLRNHGCTEVYTEDLQQVYDDMPGLNWVTKKAVKALIENYFDVDEIGHIYGAAVWAYDMVVNKW